MARPEIPPAPPGLSAEARTWWKRFHEGWEIGDDGRLLLQLVLEAMDRMRGAQRAIKREGLTTRGRAHPATVVERDARLAVLRGIRQLGLDAEPLRPGPGRPPGRGA